MGQRPPLPLLQRPASWRSPPPRQMLLEMLLFQRSYRRPPRARSQSRGRALRQHNRIWSFPWELLLVRLVRADGMVEVCALSPRPILPTARACRGGNPGWPPRSNARHASGFAGGLGVENSRLRQGHSGGLVDKHLSGDRTQNGVVGGVADENHCIPPLERSGGARSSRRGRWVQRSASGRNTYGAWSGQCGKSSHGGMHEVWRASTRGPELPPTCAGVISDHGGQAARTRVRCLHPGLGGGAT